MLTKEMIEQYFTAYGLDLHKEGQFVERGSEAGEALKELLFHYNQSMRGINYVTLCCQNAYTDLLILLQIYYRDNYTTKKKGK